MLKVTKEKVPTGFFLPFLYTIYSEITRYSTFYIIQSLSIRRNHVLAINHFPYIQSNQIFLTFIYAIHFLTYIYGKVSIHMTVASPLARATATTLTRVAAPPRHDALQHGEHEQQQQEMSRYAWSGKPIQDQTIKLEYISTKKMLADLLTKGLPPEFVKHVAVMGLRKNP
jgi:hypothetical protein